MATKKENKRKDAAVVEDEKQKDTHKDKHANQKQETHSKSEKADSAKQEKADQQENGHHKNDKQETAAKKEKNNGAADKSEHKSDTQPEIDEGEELNGLLEIFEQEDLTAIDPDVAAEMIDEWNDIIHNTKDEDLKEVGNSLKQLKKLMSGSKTKPDQLAEVLSQLGEQVNDYADHAERGYKTKLHKLGKTLSKVGDSLTEAESADEAEE